MQPLLRYHLEKDKPTSKKHCTSIENKIAPKPLLWKAKSFKTVRNLHLPNAACDLSGMYPFLDP
jgi:hypothetical protein